MTTTQDHIRAAADAVGPRVVAIGPGAGVIIGKDAVLTNAHNVSSREPTIRFPDGSARTGTLRGADVDGDLAVIEVDTGDIEPIPWGDAPDLGADVIAVAPTRSGPRVTVGYVAATGQAFRGPRGRPVSGAIEHTAPLARGSSGSPIVNATGRLAGLNTHRRRHGFYLAVPATEALRTAVEGLARGEDRSRPQLGIAVAPPHVARRLRAAVGLDDRGGLLIREVADDTPAMRAGLRRGDLIVAAAGEPISEVDDLFTVIAANEERLSLRVVRGSDELDVAVPLSDGAREEGAV